MTEIRLTTHFDAPIEKVFEASRSIDVHMASATKTKEKAIAGVTSGHIGYGETVTWRGKHFGLMLTHQSRISEFDAPHYFVDEMEKGCFKSFRHEHHFAFENGVTTMTDVLTYETPYGIFGKLFDQFLLQRHLTDFLKQRNAFLKKSVEKPNQRAT